MAAAVVQEQLEPNQEPGAGRRRAPGADQLQKVVLNDRPVDARLAERWCRPGGQEAGKDPYRGRRLPTPTRTGCRWRDGTVAYALVALRSQAGLIAVKLTRCGPRCGSMPKRRASQMSRP